MPLMQSSPLNITKLSMRSLLLKSMPTKIISTFKTNLKFLSIVMDAVLLYRCTVIVRGREMDSELKKRVRLERVELIARLASEGVCKERDREIALNLIAEIAGDMDIHNKHFSMIFSASPLEN